MSRPQLRVEGEPPRPDGSTLMPGTRARSSGCGALENYAAHGLVGLSCAQWHLPPYRGGVDRSDSNLELRSPLCKKLVDRATATFPVSVVVDDHESAGNHQ